MSPSFRDFDAEEDASIHLDSLPHFTTGDGRRTMPAKICDTHLHLSPCFFSIFQPYWLGAVSVGEYPWASFVGLCDGDHVARRRTGRMCEAFVGAGHEVVNRCRV